jgi:hypothetical protein
LPWRGEGYPGISGAHKRHRKALPSYCERCGRTDGRLDAALRPDAPVEHLLGDVRRKRHYSLRTEDYERLCRSCHLKQDRKGKAPSKATQQKGTAAAAAARRGQRLTPKHRARIGAANKAYWEHKRALAG